MNHIFTLQVYWIESSWKQFLSGEPYPVTRPWPESVSEVSAECEFPVCLIKINVMAEVSSPTREICNSLSLSTQKWVMTDCPLRQEKAASEDFVTSRCSSNPTLSLIQWRKPTKVKAVHKVRNKDLVLPIVLGWQFWDSSGKPRTRPAVSMKRQATEVEDLLWSHVPCGRLE